MALSIAIWRCATAPDSPRGLMLRANPPDSNPARINTRRYVIDRSIQAPLLRFLSLQHIPAHAALRRKGHFRAIPLRRLIFDVTFVNTIDFALVVLRASAPATLPSHHLILTHWLGIWLARSLSRQVIRLLASFLARRTGPDLRIIRMAWPDT